MDVRIMSHTSVQILAQIRPDGNLHMIFLSQFRPDGAHTYRGTFGGPAVSVCRVVGGPPKAPYTFVQAWTLCPDENFAPDPIVSGFWH